MALSVFFCFKYSKKPMPIPHVFVSLLWYALLQVSATMILQIVKFPSNYANLKVLLSWCSQITSYFEVGHNEFLVVEANIWKDEWKSSFCGIVVAKYWIQKVLLFQWFLNAKVSSKHISTRVALLLVNLSITPLNNVSTFLPVESRNVPNYESNLVNPVLVNPKHVFPPHCCLPLQTSAKLLANSYLLFFFKFDC